MVLIYIGELVYEVRLPLHYLRTHKVFFSILTTAIRDTVKAEG